VTRPNRASSPASTNPLTACLSPARCASFRQRLSLT